MKNIEIPYIKNRGKRYRFFEMLPGLISWSILVLPFVLSQVSLELTIIFVIAYLLMWFMKAIGLNIRVLQGWRTMQQHQKLNWTHLLEEIESGSVSQPDRHIPAWHYANVRRLQEHTPILKPSDIMHAIIIATWNESREVLQPTLESVLASHYDMQKVIVVLAYEERGGSQVEAQAKQLMADYSGKFFHTMAVKHIDAPGEMIGKGGNITNAGRALQHYLEQAQFDPLKVVVTTLDADNRPHPKYLASLTYLYAVCPDPLHVSFQPIPIYTNNIWDAPAPMRVIATGNSFWNIVLSLRPHLIRNFSSHAQSMQTLLDTDFWSVRTIVEDGHQFWRTYFRYDGKHEVYPLFIPIYQDAVFTGKLRSTLKAQFIQLRRWAWGASDVAYVVEMGFFRDNDVPKLDLTLKIFRLLEGHVSWATAPLIGLLAGYIPGLFYHRSFAASQLPHIASYIQDVALAGIIVTLYLSLKMLPPKPKRYKAHRTLFMILQWVYLPPVSIVYSSFAALNAQTRLILGKYLGKFDLTEKARVTEDDEIAMGYKG